MNYQADPVLVTGGGCCDSPRTKPRKDEFGSQRIWLGGRLPGGSPPFWRYNRFQQVRVIAGHGPARIGRVPAVKMRASAIPKLKRLARRSSFLCRASWTWPRETVAPKNKRTVRGLLHHSLLKNLASFPPFAIRPLVRLGARYKTSRGSSDKKSWSGRGWCWNHRWQS